MNKKTIHVRLTDLQIEKLNQNNIEYQKTKSQIIGELIEKYL
jgi:predicted DNA-binding protein